MRAGRLAAACLLLAGAARAQDSPNLEEIVVTARKQEESLQDVPVAVSAFTQEQLGRYNVSDLTKLGQMTPQLFVSEAATGNNGSLSIRGMGSGSVNAGFDQAVSIYLDGLQYDRGSVLAQGYFDLARVEVMKGPQALFFGKNNTAGVVSLTSADPGPEREWIGRYGHEFDADEHWVEAIGSGPVTETFSARLALRYSLLDGYVENLAPATIDPGSLTPVPKPADRIWPNKDELLGRLTLTFLPVPALDVKLKVAGAVSDTAGQSQSFEMFSCKALGHAQLDLGENCRQDRKVRQNDVAPEIAVTEPSFDEEGGALYNKYRAYNLALTANYDLAAWAVPAALTFVGGYTFFDNRALNDVDFTGTSLVFAAEEVRHRSISAELRMLTAFDFPANVMVGGYYQTTDLFYGVPAARLLPLPRDPTTGRYITWGRHSETDGSTISPFAQLIWNVTDTLEFSPGVRYSHVVKDSFAVNDYVHPLARVLFRRVGDRLSDRFSDDDLSPEITATWRPDWSDLTIYGAYKKGFKSGGFNNSTLLRAQTSRNDLVFDSEKVSGFEGGAKSTWLDRTLRVNAVGYRYEFTDLQVHFFDSANVDLITQNAGAVTTTGGEIELEWLPPVEGLNLHGAASYNVARYDEFLSFCYAGQSATAGCNLDAAGAPAVGLGTHQDLSGTPTPLAPRWATTMGLAYQHPLVDLFGRSLVAGWSVDSSFSDNYLLSPVGRRDVYQESFFRTDASLTFFEPGGPFELSLFGRNLSNAYFISVAASDATASGAATGAPIGLVADQIGVANRPREVGIQLTGRF